MSLTRQKSGKAKEETNDYIFERGCVSCMLLLVCVRGVCWGVWGVGCLGERKYRRKGSFVIFTNTVFTGNKAPTYLN